MPKNISTRFSKILLLILFIGFRALSSYGQCGSANISQQIDIDNFTIDYPNCIAFQNITLPNLS